MNARRQSCIEKSRTDVQDVLVVGAGINGAVAAAALAGRGAKITIIDKGDFSSCTSQSSSNLVWGGIKYLESYEFGLVWKLCKSRNRLMDAYPGQVHEIRFFTSIAKEFRKPRVLVYLGALLYWFMGHCKTKPPRLLSRKTIRREAPMVNTAQLAGGIEYSDCYLVENDARFVFGFIRKVLENGGSAINYMELVSAEWRGDLWHCTLRDHVSGEAFGLQAKSIVNATGPFADRVNTLLGIESRFRHIFSKGVHIIVPPITETAHVLTFFASDGRLFFMVPMGDRTCIGTTDTRVESEAVAATDADIDFLLANANALLDLRKPLVKSDVIATRCGVRPLVVKREADVGYAEWTALSRRHEIEVHPAGSHGKIHDREFFRDCTEPRAGKESDRKMLAIYGGKLTDCLNVGDEVVERIQSLGIHLSRPAGSHGKIHDREFFRDCAVPRSGEECGRPVDLILGHCTRRELERISREEMVVHLEDFLRRRTMLELTMGREALRFDPDLREAARVLFGENAESELERYFEKPSGSGSLN